MVHTHGLCLSARRGRGYTPPLRCSDLTCLGLASRHLRRRLGTGLGVLRGVGMWLWVWQGLWGPLAIVMSVFAGLFFGLAMTGFFRWRAARFTIVVGRVPRGLTRANECVNKRVRLSFSGLWPYGIGFSATIAPRLFAPDPLQVVLMPWVIVTLFLKMAVGVNTVSAVGPLPEFIPGV